jgi:hypothetical protein
LEAEEVTSRGRNRTHFPEWLKQPESRFSVRTVGSPEEDVIQRELDSGLASEKSEETFRTLAGGDQVCHDGLEFTGCAATDGDSVPLLQGAFNDMKVLVADCRTQFLNVRC